MITISPLTITNPHAVAPLRKKSGELVRPSLKNSYTPRIPKNVRFDPQLKYVRFFSARDCPMAVGSVGKESTLAIRLPNMPFREGGSYAGWSESGPDVQLDSLKLSDDAQTLGGIVTVRNLAFDKRVSARFTLDSWQTRSDVAAKYLDSPTPLVDRFAFDIKLGHFSCNMVGRTMEMAIQYKVAGREIWDSNAAQNYRVIFVSPPTAPSRSAFPPAPVPAPVRTAKSPLSSVFENVTGPIFLPIGSQSSSIALSSNSGVAPRQSYTQSSYPNHTQSAYPNHTRSIYPTYTQSACPVRPLRTFPASPQSLYCSTPLPSFEPLSARYNFKNAAQELWNPPSYVAEKLWRGHQAFAYIASRAVSSLPSVRSNDCLRSMAAISLSC
ncbi:carbohydrate-binding module family 21 protein [Botryobasidium botryosum FD-172 SS1]|uniref:Carbohydrate-binding module family 21 protein n=1 Tax=Botryobasidium botryosum (strain FD-172 SS1) TaxID=930990 RepID=A0A067MSX2_BOTB1|nr:carbohydrate-binding module family 21 protein [Botryobasidium botryosum FD-172 SS1]